MVILVGIDDTPASADALRWASRMATASGSELCAVRAWFYGRLSALHRDEPLADANEMDRQVAADARTMVDDVLGAGSGVEVSVVRGLPRHALAEEVRRVRPDMVVVGHRPLGEFDSLMLGSVGRRLLETSPCPVVLVRSGTLRATAERSSVVVGVDGSADSLHAAEVAAEVARALGAELVVAHAALASARLAVGVVAPDAAGEHAILAAASRHLSDAGVEHRLVLEWGDPRTVLEDVALREQAELLVVATRGEGGLSKLVLGSVATYVTHHVEMPVAVVPPLERSS